jgi:hypothetical protein
MAVDARYRGDRKSKTDTFLSFSLTKTGKRLHMKKRGRQSSGELVVIEGHFGKRRSDPPAPDSLTPRL